MPGREGAAKVPRTRMAPYLAGPKKTDLVAELDKLKGDVAVVKAKVKKPDVALRGNAIIDDQFAGEMFFSPVAGDDGGRTYGAMLSNPEPGDLYYWKCRIEQHKVDPLLQGFEVLWDPPPGWTFEDGHGAQRFYEAISNPLDVKRVVKCPASPNELVGFLATIVTKFRS